MWVQKTRGNVIKIGPVIGFQSVELQKVLTTTRIVAVLCRLFQIKTTQQYFVSLSSDETEIRENLFTGACWKELFLTQRPPLVDALYYEQVHTRCKLCSVARSWYHLLHPNLWLTCWPLAPKVAGSNPAEAVGFLGT
jgi:hypothetical protein